MSLREDARPILADLSRQRDEHERHISRHPCDGARRALADVDRSERYIYDAINAEEQA